MVLISKTFTRVVGDFENTNPKPGHNRLMNTFYKHSIHKAVGAAGVIKQKCVATLKAAWSDIISRWLKNRAPVAFIFYKALLDATLIWLNSAGIETDTTWENKDINGSDSTSEWEDLDSE